MKEIKLREYGRTELALLYCPTMTPQGAWRKLKMWIEINCDLRRELERLGYRKGHRSFTPRMVSRIFYYLGEP